MGFQDLKTFNLAMLAKQGWKIIHNPKSLVAKILKARYFPYSFLMEANYGTSPSYAWRSLMDGREVLKQGLVWRIGDGISVDIRTSKWIPTFSNFSIQDSHLVLS